MASRLLTRLVRGVRRRLRGGRRRGDAGSMPLALLVTLTAVTLSAGLSGTVTAQLRDTARAADRVAAVSAAQAGLDAALKAIRDTFTVAGGLLAKLPCSTLTGALTTPGRGTAPSYSSSIGYFLIDPTNLTASLQGVGDLTNISKIVTGQTTLGSVLSGATSAISGVVDTSVITGVLDGAVPCVAGVLQQVPLYGLLRSVGSAGTVTRTLYATYTFHTSEDNIPGGQIVVTGTTRSGLPLCLGDAGADPKAGDQVSAVACPAADTKATTFIYPTSLALVLSQTRTSSLKSGSDAYPYGLCVNAAAQTAGAKVSFEKCVVSPVTTAEKTAFWKQQWSYDVNNKTFYGTANGTSSSGFCLTMANSASSSLSAPVAVTLTNTCGGQATSTSTSGLRNFDPVANVGAGSAGAKTGQLVSYGQVGRCLDLTNENANWGGQNGIIALITYPCKQSFDGNTYWNHKWTTPVVPTGLYSVTGSIFTTPATGKYDAGIPQCLRSPGSAGGYVWVGRCALSTGDLLWTVYDAAPDPAKSYTIVDVYGNCLMPSSTAKLNGSWSFVVAAKCDGSDAQKWNKPAFAMANALKGIREK